MCFDVGKMRNLGRMAENLALGVRTNLRIPWTLVPLYLKACCKQIR